MRLSPLFAHQCWYCSVGFSWRMCYLTGFYQDYLHNCPGFDPGVMSRCWVSALFLISRGFLLPERAPTTAGAIVCATECRLPYRSHFKGSQLYDRFTGECCGLSFWPRHNKTTKQQYRPNRGGILSRAQFKPDQKEKKNREKEYPELLKEVLWKSGRLI